jgi:hypothetical protein
LRLVAGQPLAGDEKPATSPGTVSAGPGGAPRKPADNWSEADELPLLARTTIRPIRNADEFSIEPGEIRYPREPRPLRATERPFEKDDDAVTAARAWITAHLGRLPKGTSLDVVRIDHSSSGRDKPAFGWDQGHTIVFREQYHGLPTDSTAVIYLAGRTQFDASLGLHTFSPIPGTAKRIVDKAAALKAWQDRIKEKGYSASVLAEYGYGKNAKPRLVYVWSKVHYLQRHSDVIAPTWALDREGKFLVDGHTGAAWLND